MPTTREENGSSSRSASARERLADVLVAVIDAESDGRPLLRRKEWAEILGVSEPTLSYWTRNEHAPSARHLRSILDVARRDSRFAPALARLETVLDAPLASSIGPGRAEGEKPGTTLRHLLVAPIREAFLGLVEMLPPSAQERVLFDAARLAREARSSEGARPQSQSARPSPSAALDVPPVDVAMPAIWSRAEPNELARGIDYATLYRTARATRNELVHGRTTPAERAELTVMLFAFMSVEAYLNQIGAELLSTWPQVEPKLSPLDKLDFLDKSLELNLETRARPFDALVNMFRFWRTAVHAAPSVAVDITTSTRREPQLIDASQLTMDNAVRFYEDAGEMIRKIHQRLDRSGDPLAVGAAVAAR